MSGIPTSEVLYEAANCIEREGWVQGDGWPGEHKQSEGLCLEGGIMAAIGMTDIEGGNLDRLWRCPAHNAVAEYLETHSLFQWNDKLGRTAGEVIATLRAAAVIEAAKENTEAREQVAS